MKKLFLTAAFAALLLFTWAKSNRLAVANSNSFIGTWQYEQDLCNDHANGHILKKQFTLELFKNGTYHQTVSFVVNSPLNSMTVYELDGLWFAEKGKLYIHENDSNYAVEVTEILKKIDYGKNSVAEGSSTAETKTD